MLTTRSCCCFLLLFAFSGSALAQIEGIKSYYKQINTTTAQHHISFVQPDQKLVDDYEQLQQIMLIRHGEPALKKDGWSTRKEAIQFIQQYDSVGVYPLSFMPAALGSNDPDTIYTSTLNRAKHTARLIFGPELQYKEDSIFREFERKIICFPNVKLPLKFWLNVSRIIWLIGGNDAHIESFRDAKKRAENAAERLIRSADANKKVALVAHGFLNRYLVKILRRKGWHLVRKGGSDYLSTTVLVKLEAEDKN